MRRLRLATGGGLLVAAAGLLVFGWDTPVDPTAYLRVRHGMTPAEVEAVMGREGKPWFMYTSGDPRYWSQRDHFARYWEAPDFGVVVSFDGPRGQPTVTWVGRQEKAPRDFSEQWLGLCGAAILALVGLWLIAAGSPNPPAA